MLVVKRVYEPPGRQDGTRVPVERLWPRGMKKESLKADAWLVVKGCRAQRCPAPLVRPRSGEVGEFCRRHRAELDARKEAWRRIPESARRGTVTLFYSARDTEHNSTLTLKEYLEKHMNT